MGPRLYEDLKHASLYARYRPTTPRSLIALLCKTAAEHLPPGGSGLKLAVDVGCGSGQATQLLGEWCASVLGTDISAAQIKEAKLASEALNAGDNTPEKSSRNGNDHGDADTSKGNGTSEAVDNSTTKSSSTPSEGSNPSEAGSNYSAKSTSTHSKIHFAVSAAEVIPADANSVQLLMTVQAAHWFNLPHFFTEAERVLSPGGILALVGYKLPVPIFNDIPFPQLRDLLADRYVHGLRDWIQKGSIEVYIDNYSDPRFQSPLADHRREDCHFCDVSGTVKDLLGYCSTWSGFQKMAREAGEQQAEDFLQELKKGIVEALGDGVTEESPLTMRFEYFALISRKSQ